MPIRKTKNQVISIRISRELLARLDKLRRKERPKAHEYVGTKPSRSYMINKILETQLTKK